jgi:hypothetical protein
MDTSETYIKMCEKAVKIQKLRHKPTKDDSIEPWLDGDFFCIHPPVEYPDEDDEIGIGYNCNDYFYSQPEGDAVWLPRQDQLQEMVIGKGVLAGDWLDVLEHFVMDEGGLFDLFDTHRIDTTYNYTKSFEQLWLAFVMKKKYNKVWDGEDWVIGKVLAKQK